MLMTYVEECHSWNFERKLLKTIEKTFGWIAMPKMFFVKAEFKGNHNSNKVIGTSEKGNFLLNLIKNFHQVW